GARADGAPAPPATPRRAKTGSSGRPGSMASSPRAAPARTFAADALPDSLPPTDLASAPLIANNRTSFAAGRWPELRGRPPPRRLSERSADVREARSRLGAAVPRPHQPHAPVARPRPRQAQE